MSPTRDPMLRLFDILDACDRIIEHRPASRAEFDRDEMLQVWVIHHTSVIGEASVHVPSDIRASHPEVDWVALKGMRNRLVLGYFNVDLDVVWEVVATEIPRLRELIAAIVRETDDEGEGIT